MKHDSRARRLAADLLTGSLARFAAVVVDLICLAVSKLAARARFRGRGKRSRK
jgi:hypothetical protein